MRRSQALVALTVLAAAGASGWYAVDRQVRVVTVEGQLAESEAAEIRRRIGQVLEGRLLTMDVSRLRERVLELSWPDKVSVRKVWPDTIVVRVARRTVVARWADSAYLTPGGEIVSTPNGPLDVPVFDCALASPREAMEVYRYLQGMAADAHLVIERVSENEIGEWQLGFAAPAARRVELAPTAGVQAGNGGPTVMLGADSVRERMQRFLAAWSKFLVERAAAVDYVDLRYGSGMAVRWRQAAAHHAGSGTTGRSDGNDMTSENDRARIVGLDIGTSKVAAIVAELAADGGIEVIGIGSHRSHGLKKGVVVDIESTVHSIQRAVEEAELMAGCPIDSVYAGIAGRHISSFNSHGIVAIRDREVLPQDLERVIDAAQAMPVPADQRTLHILPQEYVIDNQEGVREPLGMSGVRLEAKVHLVTCSVNAAQNIEKCIGQCGLKVNELVLEQWASSYSVLSEDERDLGVCLVDIGGGTTDIAVFTGGAIRHTKVIPIAGDQVTNDIATALRTPTQNAEEIKIKYACALPQLAQQQEMIKVPGVGDRPARELSRQTLAEVVEARYDELFTLIQAELRGSGFEDLIAAGVVLTGGASKMEGLAELAEEIFHVPVSVGSPGSVTGLKDIVRNPIYATGVGLLMYGKERQEGKAARDRRRGGGTFGRFRNWLSENF